jgi:integrase
MLDTIRSDTPAELRDRMVEMETLREEGLALEARRRAPATQKVYDREIKAFEVWTTANGFSNDPGDPAAVYGYLVHLSKIKALATVLKIAACLSSVAQERGHLSPLKNPRVAAALDGLRRKTAEEQIPTAQRAALPLDDLRRALDTIDRSTLKGKRDAALLLLGFAGAMRRSEIVGVFD